MSEPVEVGRITITRTWHDESGEFGDMVDVHLDGDQPLVTLLGMLRMAEDTLLRGAVSDEDDDI